AQRIHPSLDDKMLASWNGLMIAALARAGQAFENEDITQLAAHAADALLERMRDPDGRLLRRLRGTEAGIPGFLEDYAFVVWGLIDLYEATFHTRYLHTAVDLADRMLILFGDPSDGGLFFTASDAEQLIVRSKEAQDGALPSGNSAAALSLLRLSKMTGNMEYERRAMAITEAFASVVDRYPTGHSVMLWALHTAQQPGTEIVLCGATPDHVRDMARAVRSRWLPDSVLLYRSDGEDDALDALAPYTATHRPINDEATAYVCRGFACAFPVASVEKMLELLDRPQ
ncbi:MAG: thioredoxin domain-containing protein, partial [Bacteroidetes bacterium]|nr:thioredoxin domain-containing protein [Bacteroidota bacterium]